LQQDAGFQAVRANRTECQGAGKARRLEEHTGAAR
jgi:hypothetical protein